MAWWDIAGWIKRYFSFCSGIKIKETVMIDPNKQYLWILKDATPEESHKFARDLFRARKEHTDIVVPDRFRIVPTSSIQITMEHSGIKSRTHMLRIVKAALGTAKDFSHISEILISGEGLVKVTKYWGQEDGEKQKPKQRGKSRGHR